VARKLRRYVVAFPVQGGDERVLGEGIFFTLSLDGKEAFYGVPAGAGMRLWAVPRTGGAARVVGDIPDQPFDIVAASDGYLHLDNPPLPARRLPMAGGALSEEAPAPWLLVYPAPAGGYTLAFRDEAATGRMALDLLAPGARVGSPPVQELPDVVNALWAPDGKSFYAKTSHEIRRHWIGTGAVETILPGTHDCQHMALSPDGRTFYFTQIAAHVQRQAIANFGDRPPLR
jgi:hypothetical protein